MKEELFALVNQYAYRYAEKPFTLASGKESHHYFNCKELLLYPDRLALLAQYLVASHIPQLMTDVPQAVGGLTLGADPLSYAVSLQYHRDGHLVYPLVVRKETKQHGTRRPIEGAVGKVTSCLVMDDVITTGGSTLKAVFALREAGIAIDKALCIIDRQEGGQENLQKEGIELFAIFRKSDFLEANRKSN